MRRNRDRLETAAGQRPEPGRTELVVRGPEPLGGMTKIGDVARMFGISTQTIRLYEVEGLLISYKSDAGTRWYSESDIEWIRALQGLLDDGLNFAGIRRLLAQIPCWELKPCRLSDSAVCPARLDARLPCWLSPADRKSVV